MMQIACVDVDEEKAHLNQYSQMKERRVRGHVIRSIMVS
jgi:hypothetical protein